MATDVHVDYEWKGDDILRRGKRAVARGTIAIAENIGGHAKRNAHVISGDLRRSIHVAAHNSGGLGRATAQAAATHDGALVDVGSWLDYACVEEVGRGHRYMQPAVEEGRTTAHLTMRAAFAAEGLV